MESAAEVIIAPDYENIAYGAHERQVFDFWKARTDKAAPLFVWIHGGGFMMGDKSSVQGQNVEAYLERGFAVASLHYRFTDTAPFPAQMHDAARALQFIRYHADEYGIDGRRVACAGGSAGAGISQWLGYHADLADPDADDPIARQSTRIQVIGAMHMQCTYDPRLIKEMVPGDAYQHTAMKRLFGVGDDFNWDTDKIGAETDALIKECGPLSHLRKDAPPVFIQSVTRDNTDGNIHHANFGKYLEKRLQALGIPHQRCMDTDYSDPTYTSNDALREFIFNTLV